MAFRTFFISLLFLGCLFGSKLVADEVIKVKLEPKSGSKAQGLILLKVMNDGLSLLGEVGGLKANSTHGFHIHETPDCSAADAASAGGHWNPEGKAHGDTRVTHSESHAGDLGNLTADAHGIAKVKIFLKGYQLAPGPLSLKEHSFVVHEDKDDLKTQPSGNSGKRIACGVIR